MQPDKDATLVTFRFADATRALGRGSLIHGRSPLARGPSGLRPLASIVSGSGIFTSNGLAKLTVDVIGRCTFLGSRHESEQTPPHPKAKLLVVRYAPSRLTRASFGPGGDSLPF
jgi:hypothetical protein